jgi:DNA modification methylase
MALAFVDELPISKIDQPKIFSITSNGLSSYTHGFFKYLCKFIPHVPRWALKKYIKTDNPWVLDPFCGSGTTLVESALLGCNAIGVDFDPLSNLITRAKSTPLKEKQITKLKSRLSDLIIYIEKCRHIDQSLIPSIPNIDLWFSRKASDDLVKIKQGINRFKEESNDSSLEDFLNVCFASIIKRVSNADSQSPKPYVSKKIKKIPGDAIDLFKKVALTNIEKLEDFSSAAVPSKSFVVRGDARSVDDLVRRKLLVQCVDLAVTSPPYINAFDYVRSLKLENLWLDLLDPDELGQHNQEQIGTEKITFDSAIISSMQEYSNLYQAFHKIVEKDRRRAYVVMKYFYDMRLNLISVKNILKPRGTYCIVVGNSRIRDVEIPTHKYLIQIAENVGFKLDSLFGYVIKNPYLRIPRKGRGGLIKVDWVISLKRTN